MTKQAYKNEYGQVVFTEKSDSKKCLTCSEFMEWLNESEIPENLTVPKSEFILETYTKNRRTFYKVEFNIYENYIKDIGKLHEMFGRNIEVETLWTGEKMECHVRGYSDFR